jgi:hypothetical protein
MSARASLVRRLAVALMAHAAEILPPARSTWAEAMIHEIRHMEGDLEALRWAVGCVLASYLESIKVMNMIHTWYARWLLALLIVGQALSLLFATVLTVAYREHYLGVAELLGGFTPGDDYRRFIPLMDETPLWLHALCVAAGVLFLVSAWQLLRSRRAAVVVFAAAWVLGAVGDWISHAIPVYKEVFSFSSPQFRRDYLIPAATALLPLFMAAALWQMTRRRLQARADPTDISS